MRYFKDTIRAVTVLWGHNTLRNSTRYPLPATHCDQKELP